MIAILDASVARPLAYKQPALTSARTSSRPQTLVAALVSGVATEGKPKTASPDESKGYRDLPPRTLIRRGLPFGTTLSGRSRFHRTARRKQHIAHTRSSFRPTLDANSNVPFCGLQVGVSIVPSSESLPVTPAKFGPSPDASSHWRRRACTVRYCAAYPDAYHRGTFVNTSFSASIHQLARLLVTASCDSVCGLDVSYRISLSYRALVSASLYLRSYTSRSFHLSALVVLDGHAASSRRQGLSRAVTLAPFRRSVPPPRTRARLNERTLQNHVHAKQTSVSCAYCLSFVFSRPSGHTISSWLVES